MTGDGSTPFQGESSLTFDGSRLFIQGKLRIIQQTLSISGGAVTWALRSGANATVTLDQNVSSFSLSEFETGDTGVLVVKQTNTGGGTMVLPANSVVMGGGSYVATPTANATDVLGVYFDGTFYYWTIGSSVSTGSLITINNNADNRVLTASGSASSINAESGLTYNAATSTMGLGGRMQFTANGTLPTDATASFLDQTSVGPTISGLNFQVRTGATPAARMLLNSTGTLTVSEDIVAYGSPSDARLKIIKRKIQDPLSKILSLNGYEFDWKETDSVLNIKEDIGVIAQEVQDVLPELVRENENGYLSVRHQGIAPVLIEAVKELHSMVIDLKAELEKLKGEK
jgi:hypothetical protein